MIRYRRTLTVVSCSCGFNKSRDPPYQTLNSKTPFRKEVIWKEKRGETLGNHFYFQTNKHYLFINILKHYITYMWSGYIENLGWETKPF